MVLECTKPTFKPRYHVNLTLKTESKRLSHPPSAIFEIMRKANRTDTLLQSKKRTLAISESYRNWCQITVEAFNETAIYINYLYVCNKYSKHTWEVQFFHKLKIPVFRSTQFSTVVEWGRRNLPEAQKWWRRGGDSHWVIRTKRVSVQSKGL